MPLETSDNSYRGSNDDYKDRYTSGISRRFNVIQKIAEQNLQSQDDSIFLQVSSHRMHVTDQKGSNAEQNLQPQDDSIVYRTSSHKIEYEKIFIAEQVDKLQKRLDKIQIPGVDDKASLEEKHKLADYLCREVDRIGSLLTSAQKLMQEKDVLTSDLANALYQTNNDVKKVLDPAKQTSPQDKLDVMLQLKDRIETLYPGSDIKKLTDKIKDLSSNNSKSEQSTTHLDELRQQEHGNIQTGEGGMRKENNLIKSKLNKYKKYTGDTTDDTYNKEYRKKYNNEVTFANYKEHLEAMEEYKPDILRLQANIDAAYSNLSNLSSAQRQLSSKQILTDIATREKLWDEYIILSQSVVSHYQKASHQDIINGLKQAHEIFQHNIEASIRQLLPKPENNRQLPANDKDRNVRVLQLDKDINEKLKSLLGDKTGKVNQKTRLKKAIDIYNDKLSEKENLIEQITLLKLIKNFEVMRQNIDKHTQNLVQGAMTTMADHIKIKNQLQEKIEAKYPLPNTEITVNDVNPANYPQDLFNDNNVIEDSNLSNEINNIIRFKPESDQYLELETYFQTPHDTSIALTDQKAFVQDIRQNLGDQVAHDIVLDENYIRFLQKDMKTYRKNLTVDDTAYNQAQKDYYTATSHEGRHLYAESFKKAQKAIIKVYNDYFMRQGWKDIAERYKRATNDSAITE